MRNLKNQTLGEWSESEVESEGGRDAKEKKS